MLMRFFSRQLLDRLYTNIELKFSQYKETLQRLKGPAVEVATNKIRGLLAPMVRQFDGQKPSQLAMFLPETLRSSVAAQELVVDTLTKMVETVHSEYTYTQRTTLDDPETIKFIGYYSWLNCFLPDGFLFHYELHRLRLNTQASTGDISASQTRFLSVGFFVFHIIIQNVLLDTTWLDAPIKSDTQRILRHLAGHLFYLFDNYFQIKEEPSVQMVPDYAASVIERGRIPSPTATILDFGEPTAAANVQYDPKKCPIVGLFPKFEVSPLLQNEALCAPFYQALQEFANEIFNGIVLVRMTVEALQISKKVQVMEATALKMEPKHPDYAAKLREYAVSLKESYSLA